MYAIETYNLTKKYLSKNVVNNLTLIVKYNEIFCFLGERGAGKTTLLRMLTTVIPPTSGDAEVRGYSILRDPIRVRQEISVLTEVDSLNPVLNVFENILTYLQFKGYSGKQARDLARQALIRYGLREHAGKSKNELSPELRKLVQLARVLIADTPLIFLDEPTAGLDHRAKYQVWDYIKEAKGEGKTIIINSSSTEEAEALADRVSFLYLGNALAINDLDVLKSSLGHVSALIKMGSLTPTQEKMLMAFLEKWAEPVGVDFDQSRFTLKVIGMSGISTLLAFVSANHIPVTSLGVQEPTLQEVYYKVMGGK